MNRKHLMNILDFLKSGSLLETPQKLNFSRGGSCVWRVITDKDSFAIKHLASNLDLSNENLILRYELTENVAYQFMRKGIAQYLL